MASEVTKVRLVRCPKCRLVLPELPEFNVYKCGGCGATLQAKNRVSNATSTSVLSEADAVQETQTDHVNDDKEEPSSSNEDVVPGSAECSLSQNNERDQSGSGDCDGEQLGGMNLSCQNQNNGTHQSDSSDCDAEGSEVSNEVFSPTEFVDSRNEEFALKENDELGNNEGSEVSNEVFSPTEFVDSKNEEFALNENDEPDDNENKAFANNGDEEFARSEIEELAAKKNEEEIAHNGSKGCDDNGNKEFSHCEIEEFAHIENEFTEEFAHNENEEFTEEFARTENEEFSENQNEKLAQNQSEELTQNRTEESAHNENESLSLARADLEVPVDDESSLLAEATTVNVNEKSDSDSNVRSSNSVNLVATTGNGSGASVHMPLRETIQSDTLIPSSGEQPKQPQKIVNQRFGRLRSEEFNPSSELSGTLGGMSKSPTRSSHAYDGSISSYDGMEDQFLNRHLHSFGDTYKTASFVHSEERWGRDKFLVQNMMNRDSEMQQQARPSWSDKTNHAMRNSKWDRDEFPEPARHDRTVRNWRLDRHERQTSSAFRRMSSLAGYENGGPSNQLHDELRRNSSFQSYEWSEDPEQVKMKLLRMVFELQDQLNKTRSLHTEGNDGISGLSRKERYVPRYHNYEVPREEPFHPSNYPRFSGRYSAGSHYSHRRRMKKMPFSGETTSSTSHQFDPSYSHGCRQDWQRSPQLPPPSHYNISGLCRLHPGHNYCPCHSSCPSSPQWSVDSEYTPWGRETQSDDQRRRSQDMTNYLREKQRFAKRHFRPIAGGAPLIVCYSCFKLLQLPADFLLFKRKCHRLRCGACLEVLKFSIQNGSHIVRYAVNTVDPPPPSEAEDYSDDINRRNMASTSQTLHVDPLSCSDDYGLSYCKSCSTEGDPAFTTPFRTPYDKRILHDVTRDAKESVRTQSQGKNKPRYEFIGPSSNIPSTENLSSEIEEVPQRASSPLHRLMGYSSPSQVIYGPAPSGKGRVHTLSREKSEARK